MPRVRSLNQQSDKITKMFKIALIEKGWTQEHLAKICGKEKHLVNSIINDPEHRTFSNVLAVARALGINEIPVVR